MSGASPTPVAGETALDTEFHAEAPLVSVIIPTYNVGEFIGETLRSVLGQQGVRNFEVLLVDDRSTDDTVAQAQAAAGSDPRLRVLHNTGPQGAAGARNHGLARANGEWVAFLDGDDLWMPHNLRLKLAAAATAPDIDIVSSDFYNENRANRTVPRAEWPTLRQSLLPTWQRHVGPPSDGSSRVLRLDNLTQRFLSDEVLGNTGTFMLRRRAVQALGGFDTTLAVGEDVYLWLQLSQRSGQMLFVHRPLMFYRHRPGSLTNQDYPAHAFFAARFYAHLAVAPEFRTYRKLVHLKLASAWLAQSHYFRKTAQHRESLRTALRACRYRPASAAHLKNALACLVRRT